MRANLLDVRRDLRTQNKKAHLKYLPEWPFLKLVVVDGENREERLPEEDIDEIVEVYLGLRERPERPAAQDGGGARGRGRGRGRGGRGNRRGYRGRGDGGGAPRQ